jgi:hypothetical protein
MKCCQSALPEPNGLCWCNLQNIPFWSCLVKERSPHLWWYQFISLYEALSRLVEYVAKTLLQPTLFLLSFKPSKNHLLGEMYVLMLVPFLYPRDSSCDEMPFWRPPLVLSIGMYRYRGDGLVRQSHQLLI